MPTEDALIASAVARLGMRPPGGARAVAERRPYVIVSADIRKSTFLMKEAQDLAEYARIMTGFIRSARNIVGNFGGWFDKFMGDGFLAYWPCDLFWQHPEGGELAEGNLVARHLLEVASLHMKSAGAQADIVGPPHDDPEAAVLYGLACGLGAASLLIRTFESTHKPAFRRTTRNFRSDTGLTIGVDYGDVRLVQLGEEISVVGHPVVGAVRMTSTGTAGQMIANGMVGELVRAAPATSDGMPLGYINRRFTYDPIVVSTKEYQQEAYLFEPRARPAGEFGAAFSAPTRAGGAGRRGGGATRPGDTGTPLR